MSAHGEGLDATWRRTERLEAPTCIWLPAPLRHLINPHSVRVGAEGAYRAEHVSLSRPAATAAAAASSTAAGRLLMADFPCPAVPAGSFTLFRGRHAQQYWPACAGAGEGGSMLRNLCAAAAPGRRRRRGSAGRRLDRGPRPASWLAARAQLRSHSMRTFCPVASPSSGRLKPPCWHGRKHEEEGAASMSLRLTGWPCNGSSSSPAGQQQRLRQSQQRAAAAAAAAGSDRGSGTASAAAAAAHPAVHVLARAARGLDFDRPHVLVLLALARVKALRMSDGQGPGKHNGRRGEHTCSHSEKALLTGCCSRPRQRRLARRPRPPAAQQASRPAGRHSRRGCPSAASA